MGIAAAMLLLFGHAIAGPGSLRHYICTRAVDEIRVDGVFDEFSWTNAPRTEAFGRIRGTKIDHHTEAAMVWDDENLYVAFSCADPEMWATFLNEDDPLWGEEVVEVFIDPDADGRNYLELEVSPLNVVVDLKVIELQPKWESDFDWDIPGLQTAVKAYGTVNDSTDTDIGWNVEIAIPFAAFADLTPEAARAPEPGEQWRLNLYRIERVGGETWRIKRASLYEQAKEAREKEDYASQVQLQRQIMSIEEMTEYTCWSVTHAGGFHDPSRFGVIEFR